MNREALDARRKVTAITEGDELTATGVEDLTVAMKLAYQNAHAPGGNHMGWQLIALTYNGTIRAGDEDLSLEQAMEAEPPVCLEREHLLVAADGKVRYRMLARQVSDLLAPAAAEAPPPQQDPVPQPQIIQVAQPPRAPLTEDELLVQQGKAVTAGKLLNETLPLALPLAVVEALLNSPDGTFVWDALNGVSAKTKDLARQALTELQEMAVGGRTGDSTSMWKGGWMSAGSNWAKLVRCQAITQEFLRHDENRMWLTAGFAGCRENYSAGQDAADLTICRKLPLKTECWRAQGLEAVACFLGVAFWRAFVLHRYTELTRIEWLSVDEVIKAIHHMLVTRCPARRLTKECITTDLAEYEIKILMDAGGCSKCGRDHANVNRGGVDTCVIKYLTRFFSFILTAELRGKIEALGKVLTREEFDRLSQKVTLTFNKKAESEVAHAFAPSK